MSEPRRHLTITVSIFYLTAQMVGGGVLVKTLIGIPYEVSVIVVGVLALAIHIDYRALIEDRKFRLHRGRR